MPRLVQRITNGTSTSEGHSSPSHYTNVDALLTKIQAKPDAKEAEEAEPNNNTADDLQDALEDGEGENEAEGSDEDPCFGFESSDEEEGEENGQDVPDLTGLQNRLSSFQDESGKQNEKQKKFRRHHFIKHEICVPDKKKKYPAASKRRPWYLQGRRGELERRQDSSIAFIMPRQEDPEVLALRKTNKMVHKLIKYMKKSWKVRIDRKQSDRELEHRTLASVYTKKPDDWMDKIRAREDRSLETGFFSAMDISYDALVDLELDTAILTFKNLPPDLKITAGRWIREKLRKEELKRKRDAFLPRLPHGKMKRPSYNKGRLIKDPGGAARVDQFARVAEGFVKVSQGGVAYSKVLSDWSQKREKENYNLNSGFGVMREGMFDFSGRNRPMHSAVNQDADDGFEKNNSDQRRVSIIDARKYQRDMLYYEKMLGAMFDMVKSLLNIKNKQLESKFPLPPRAILQIRGKSPDRTMSKKTKSTPLLILQRNSMKERDARQSRVSLGDRISLLSRKSGMLSTSRRASEQMNDNPLPLESHGKKFQSDKESAAKGLNIRKSLADMTAAATTSGHEKRKSNVDTLRERLSSIGVGKTNVNDVINMSPPRSSAQLVSDIKKQHSFEDFMDIKSRRQTMLTAEQKIKRLAENPEHAAIRRARNYMTYTKLFERSRKLKKPVWHNIDIAEIASEFSKSKGLAGKDPANLTEADAAEVVDLAMKKRRSMAKRNGNGEGEDDEIIKRWPEEFDIPTPTYQFPNSRVRIGSEEQSRLDLLKKTPHMDEVPSTPVRRLYKLAGVRTTEKDIFNNIIEMKKLFRLTEQKLRVYYENEIGKLDWDIQKRFRGKLNGLKPSPVFQWTIQYMRLHHDNEEAEEGKKPGDDDEDENEDEEQKKLKQKRPALWYKKLQEECEMNGATRHNGCRTELDKLLKYCDVDMKTKPHMLNRLALLVVSLPTTELGTKHWQQAVVFLMEFMCGTPPEMIHVWLKYRGIPYLL